MNSAATFTYLKDSRTEDGWNEMYAINVLAPILLCRELLPVLQGAIVVNVASMIHSKGVVDYFKNDDKGKGLLHTNEGNNEQTLGLGEAMKQYGSCKLLLLMASYALQRQINNVSI